jgi:hypothetical protein
MEALKNKFIIPDNFNSQRSAIENLNQTCFLLLLEYWYLLFFGFIYSAKDVDDFCVYYIFDIRCHFAVGAWPSHYLHPHIHTCTRSKICTRSVSVVEQAVQSEVSFITSTLASSFPLYTTKFGSCISLIFLLQLFLNEYWFMGIK